jgi:hypothetical protein
MKRSSALFLAAALAYFGTAVPARAGFIPWSYSWSRSPAVLAADNHGTGGVAFTHQYSQQAHGNADVIATNLILFSSAPPSTPDHMYKKRYALTLVLRDGTSHKSGSLTFTGQLSGTFSAYGGSVRNTYTGWRSQSLHLGHYWYTVTMGTFISPTPLSVGTIEAHVDVRHNPEPSGLVLAGLGLAVLGLLALRRRARGKSWPAADREPALLP